MWKSDYYLLDRARLADTPLQISLVGKHDCAITALRQGAVRGRPGVDAARELPALTVILRRVQLHVGVRARLRWHRVKQRAVGRGDGGLLDAIAWVWPHEPPRVLATANDVLEAAEGKSKVHRHSLVSSLLTCFTYLLTYLGILCTKIL